MKPTLLALSMFLLGVCSCKKQPEISLDSESTKQRAAKDWQFGKSSYQYTKDIVDFGPRPVESAALEKARQYTVDQLKAAGWTCQRQTFKANTPLGIKQFTNIIARYQVPGQTINETWSRQTRAILCAHIDSKLMLDIKFVGALDAATGVAGVIELADYIATFHPREAALIEIVLFDGEEAILEHITYGEANADGLYGSLYYAKARAHSKKVGVLLDLIGHKKLDIRVPADTTKHLQALMHTSAKNHNVSSGFSVLDFAILDDHVPLMSYGTPTIDLIGSFKDNDWWHTANDDMDIVSEENIGHVLKVALDILLHELKNEI